HRRGEIHAGLLVGSVVAVSSKEEMQEADGCHPTRCLRGELPDASDLASQHGGEQEQCHPDRDGNGHTLARRARNDATPDGGIIEGKSRRRQDGQDGAQHLESLTTSAFWLAAGAWTALARELDPRESRALFLHLQRILDVIELCEFRVPQLAVDLLDLADVNRLHDVARLRID